MSQVPGPMELFEAGAPRMELLRSSVAEARLVQADLEAQLMSAKRETNTRLTELNEFGRPILERIHDSVDDETDPSDYLQAVLSMYGGVDVGRDIVEQQVAPFRERISELSVPVGIISVGSVVFGMSEGDIVVRKARQDGMFTEKGLDTSHGIILEIPLSGVSQIGGGMLASDSPRIEEASYARAKPHSFRTYQNLLGLKLAGDVEAVRDAFNAEGPKFSTHGDSSYYQTKKALGTVPIVAYGEDAVTELMIALSEGRNVDGLHKKTPPDMKDLFALAVSLGISPVNIQEISEDEVKENMREQIATALTNKSRSLIINEARKRESPNSHVNFGSWGVVLNPKVVGYSDIDQTTLVEALVSGIESTTRDLRTEDPDDKHTFNKFDNSPEHRLLLQEAQDLLVEVMSARYGADIDPSTLTSSEVERLLNEQLIAKKFDKELFKKGQEKRVVR